MSGRVTIDLPRLAKVCGLFSSNHVGERAEAARRADAIVKAAGLDWHELLTPARAHREPQRGIWRTTCEELQKRPGDLRTWERAFVADLPKFSRISTKQRYVLDEIARRVLGDRT
jgi:hypothetical protein